MESITVAANETINAIAVVEGYSSPSAVSTGVYLIGPITATPTFSPVPGSFGSTQTVTITDATAGNTIYYTTNGSTPSTGSTLYSAPITVSSTETLQAIAASAGNNNSVVATAIYTIGGTAATPTFAPVAGTYAGNQNVSINDTPTGSSIYYTVTAGQPEQHRPATRRTTPAPFLSPRQVWWKQSLRAAATPAACPARRLHHCGGGTRFQSFKRNFASAQTVTITRCIRRRNHLLHLDCSIDRDHSDHQLIGLLHSACCSNEQRSGGHRRGWRIRHQRRLSGDIQHRGSRTHFQSRCRKLPESSNGVHQRYNRRRGHLLHHGRKHADYRLDGLLRCD